MLENLERLHSFEEQLRVQAFQLIAHDKRLSMHVAIVAAAMDMIDVYRQTGSDGEDDKVVQLLGFRIFNDFASSIKLALSGYSQTAALILRDILETTFLIDHFRTDQPAIQRWRTACAKDREREFSPMEVRKYLDERDGFSDQKRKADYKLFSSLAAHPTMESFAMMRPNGMNAYCGPFLEKPTLEAVFSEMGKLAIQAGEVISEFMPAGAAVAHANIAIFNELKRVWLNEFYSQADTKSTDDG
jgi:hypothetical protein